MCVCVCVLYYFHLSVIIITLRLHIPEFPGVVYLGETSAAQTLHRVARCVW